MSQKDLEVTVAKLNRLQNRNDAKDTILIKQLDVEIVLWLEQEDTKWEEQWLNGIGIN